MPFTEAQFFDVFRRYNVETWPMSAVLTITGVVLAICVATKRVSMRTVWWTLAGLWTWTALAYHVKFFAAINPLAYVFAVLCLVQASALVAVARATPANIALPDVDRGRALVSDALFIYALVVYPLVGVMLGQRYPGLPTFGLPCPTTIFTIAVLIRVDRSAPGLLYVAPLLWAGIATVAAMRFHVAQDFVLLPSAVLGLLLRVRMPFHRAARVA